MVDTLQPARPNLINAGHYENFPVASVLLPRRLRRPIQAIYAFARAADDLADEGDAEAGERLAALAGFRARLDAIERGETPNDPIFAPLAHAVRAHALPMAPFHDLLDAFSQDVTQTRYADFGEVMAYCRKSANPVGRLLLALYRDNVPRHQAWSDGICSALQLINFLQDIAIDWKKGRVYLPQDEMERFGISERQIAEGRVDALWQRFMKTQIERTRRILQAGAPLGRALPGRIGLEMRLIVLGGERVLEKLHATQGDVFTRRPRLTALDWPSMLRRALWPGTRPGAASTPGCGGGCAGGKCGR